MLKLGHTLKIPRSKPPFSQPEGLTTYLQVLIERFAANTKFSGQFCFLFSLRDSLAQLCNLLV